MIEYLQIPDGELVEIGDPPLEKLADELTEAWVERYIREGGWLADPWMRQCAEHGDYGPALVRRLDDYEAAIHRLRRQLESRLSTEQAEAGRAEILRRFNQLFDAYAAAVDQMLVARL